MVVVTKKVHTTKIRTEVPWILHLTDAFTHEDMILCVFVCFDFCHLLGQLGDF